VFESASNAYAAVLAGAGATAPRRDPVDARIVQEVINRTGNIIDSPDDRGGYPTYAGGTPPPDGDHDGMPNAWEVSHGLNPSDPADGPQMSPTGYTWVENYINGLAMGGTNEPPQADAGADLVVTNGNAVLDGSGSGDPDGGPEALSYLWTSADAGVSIRSPNASVTAVSNLRVGTNVFVLTVSDGLDASSDEVAVVVIETDDPGEGPPPGEDPPPGDEDTDPRFATALEVRPNIVGAETEEACARWRTTAGEEEAFLRIYTVSGALVRAWDVSGGAPGENREVELDARALSPSVYFVQLERPNRIETCGLVVR
jgi:hypothetical protein